MHMHLQVALSRRGMARRDEPPLQQWHQHKLRQPVAHPVDGAGLKRMIFCVASRTWMLSLQTSTLEVQHAGAAAVG